MIKHLTAGLALAAFAPAGHGSNWLPSPPNGLFRINYRIYLPTKGPDPETLASIFPPNRKAG